MTLDPRPVEPALLDPVPVAVDEPGAGTQQLGKRAARGALLTLSGQGVKILLQVAGVVLLARMLSPGDYGLVAMTAAVIGVAEIFRDFGLSAAAVQAKQLTRGQRDNLFWLNTGAGAGLTLVVFVVAPLIALLYSRPELVELSQVLSLVFLINGMSTQFRADLNRRMRFSRMAMVEMSAPALALGVAVLVALEGGGYWALAVQQLTTAAVLLTGYAIFARWLPRLPDRSAPMRDLLNFGWHLAGSQLIGYLGNNVDSLTIGTRFGATPLGLYNRAFQLLMTPLGQLRQPTTTVALPVLARLRSEPAATNRYLERGQAALGLTLVAGLGFILGSAHPITAIFLGGQWLSVEPILRLLAAAGAFQTLAYVGLWVYLAHGLTKQLMQYTLITNAIKIACILVGSLWGVLGVAWGYALAPALAWPLSFWWLSRSSSVRVRPLYAGAGRILVLTGLIAAGSWGACELTADYGAWAQLAAGLLAAALCYLLVAAALPVFRRDISGVLEIVRAGLGKA